MENNYLYRLTSLFFVTSLKSSKGSGSPELILGTNDDMAPSGSPDKATSHATLVGYAEDT